MLIFISVLSLERLLNIGPRGGLSIRHFFAAATVILAMTPSPLSRIEMPIFKTDKRAQNDRNQKHRRGCAMRDLPPYKDNPFEQDSIADNVILSNRASEAK